MIYSEFVKVFFVRICCVFYGSQGQTRSLFFVCNLRPDFKKVKFDVRRSLEPFKDLDGCFDSSLTALTKLSQMLSNGTCVSHFKCGCLRPIMAEKRLVALHSVTIIYSNVL